ncbi:hypothetical protein C2845_PM11G12570 [Panicum miliaceum]|uniref:Uncharacterized protein n=1 Tax=Panicum miliaceum TaxID=4540 RepID=A0A3L6RU84_PANMI|nr:hypothetical protein C2845_PM11G12570 [Panicum miliaceum]
MVFMLEVNVHLLISREINTTTFRAVKKLSLREYDPLLLAATKSLGMGKIPCFSQLQILFAGRVIHTRPASGNRFKKQKIKPNANCHAGRSHSAVGAVCAPTRGTTAAPPPRTAGPPCMLGLPTPAGRHCRLPVRRAAAPPKLRAPASSLQAALHPRTGEAGRQSAPNAAGVDPPTGASSRATAS